MSNYNTSANIVLTVNGKQAQRMMSQLGKDASRLEKKVAAAATAGDKVSMKKWQRELNSTRKMMDQLRNTYSSVEQTLSRLDKATPKELNKALRTMQQQLNGLQRGTPAWDAQIAKIKQVKAELQRVNATMATQKSMWQRFNGWLNQCSTAIMGVAAAVTGLVMAGRKAVNSYAGMEESMANTIKYTRMTAGEVAELNDIFMKMDTRLAREQLNLLAQEGGRLGYNTVSSVKEYVEAASIINVALVDLGEGATQTIAKLSNIFGVEEMYGVRDSMLKIGSTVNHLSQNCTAAKPFIVEFAQRMAGVGATAKMTIPDIMAFAATLDANGQKVEMSATALQRTIMALYKKPAEMARKVGLEANTFIDTLNKNTTDGVMMFLEALNKLGESNALAVLSPLFQDLGLDGTRVSSVLTNLSAHLDFLKWQMGEANQAFREGTSASNEYAIFNNTVQASIDKARKRVSELAIELGEKLYPVMKHIYTSSGIFLRVLNQIVSFFITYRREIMAAASALLAYNTVMLIYSTRTKIAATTTLLFNNGLKFVRSFAPVYRLAVAVMTNAVQYFTNGLRVSYAMQQRWRLAMEGMKFSSWTGLILALAGAIYYLTSRTDEYKKKLKEAVNSSADFAKALSSEKRQLDTLFGKLEGCRQGTKEYKEVKDEIIKQYGRYLKGLINERGEIINLAEAYDRLAAAARTSARERAIETSRKQVQETYDDKFSDLSTKLQKSLEDSGYNLKDAVRVTTRIVSDLQSTGTISAQIKKELEGITVGQHKGKMWEHPVSLVNQMISVAGDYKESMSAIGQVEKETNPFKEHTTEQIKKFIEEYQGNVDRREGGRIIIGIGSTNPEVRNVDANELRDLVNEAKAILSERESPRTEMQGGNPDFSMDDYTPYETDRERKARETEERKAAAQAKREETKARKEFKEALNNAKGEWEQRDTANQAEYSAGLKTWSQFLLDKHNSEVQYFEDRIKLFEENNLQEDEDYQELLKKKEEMNAAWLKKNAALAVDEAKRRQKAEETQVEMDFVTPNINGSKNPLYLNEEARQQKLFEIRIKYLKQMQAAYNQGSEECHEYELQLQETESSEQLRRQQMFAAKLAEWKKEYEYKSAAERMRLELGILEEAYSRKLLSEKDYQQAREQIRKNYIQENLPDSAKASQDSRQFEAESLKKDLDKVKSLYEQGLLTFEEYEKAKERISKNYEKKRLQRARQAGSQEVNQLLDIYEAWKSFFDKSGEDGENWASKLAKLTGGVFSYMNAMMQSYLEYSQACADIEVAETEKKYDRQIELAEGNSYLTAKLEKQKEAEIAKVKNEAERKAYSMKVIMAIAQTAQNAIAAYGAGLQAGGLAGLILGPVAAAMAVAAGALQIATLKKQQQAAESQGYQSGGFTPDGKPDEVAGVVHKGEWVASQALTRNPKTRPLLEALDYAQRTNTIGSITAADVSRTITAPAVLAAQPSVSAPIINNVNAISPEATEALKALSSLSSPLSASISLLNERLNEPFVTVATVTGDSGINRAQDDYQRLLKNKSPKFKR